MGVIESKNVIYIIVILLLLLNAVVIFIAIKCAHRVDDDFELFDENGDHIYYDRKLIRHKQSEKNNKESQYE